MFSIRTITGDSCGRQLNVEHLIKHSLDTDSQAKPELRMQNKLKYKHGLDTEQAGRTDAVLISQQPPPDRQVNSTHSQVYLHRLDSEYEEPVFLFLENKAGISF